MNVKMSAKKLVIGAILAQSFIYPLTSFGASLQYSAWLPFWKKQAGAQDFALNLERFKEINPFSYEVKANGTLVDSLKIGSGNWDNWISAVKDAGVKVIPTIAILDGDQIHALLSNKTQRIKHEDAIAALVKKNKFDGIDIDYEDKWAKTRVYFNTFLMGLSDRLHAQKKILSCTIESRMSLSDRFKVPPKTMEYANDFVALNKYCDEIKMMAYDQGSIDIKLDATKGDSKMYMPVADPDWVEKVIKEAVKTISRKKLMLGVPTYGYEYEVSWQNGQTTYKRLRANTFFKAMQLAELVNVVPFRNNAGELSFIYPSSTPVSVSKNLTYIVNSVAAPAGLITDPGKTTRYVSFNDAPAIKAKIDLAKKYGLKGVAFFKMDGDIDPALWDIIK